jgi:surfactin synthase thioesterase subunit
MNTRHEDDITIYCLPFAGGNSVSYRPFQEQMPDPFRIRPVELPGRGRRIREPLLTNIHAMADDVLQQIERELNGKRYVLYGHSMGALLAYLLTQRIFSAGQTLPLHVFYSGRKAPSVPHARPLKHKLGKEDFLRYINELGGLPAELLHNPEFMSLVEPILRADFQAVETYLHQPSPPLAVPMTVLAGKEDPKTSYATILPWHEESSLPVKIEMFTGRHFFIFDHISKISKLFTATLLRQPLHIA